MKKLISASLLLVSAVFAGSASANLLVNGSFEDPNIPNETWTIETDIPGWSTVSGSGIEIRDSVAGEAADGENFVELDSNNNSRMIQTISNQYGRVTLTWAYSPREKVALVSNPIEIYWNGVKQIWQSGIGGTSGNQWVWNSMDLIATGNDTLEFAAVGTNDSYGGGIDDVQLNAVPLPAAVWLFGSALLGFVGFQKRKKA